MTRKASRLLSAFSPLPAGSLVVEVGCVRRREETAGDGWSTVYLARKARKAGWRFVSIDSDPEACAIARDLTGARIICSPGTCGVARVSARTKIAGLYLDGGASPQETAEQYEAARLADRAIVVIDDVHDFGGNRLGKGGIAIGLLERDGFRVQIHDTEPGYRMAVAAR